MSIRRVLYESYPLRLFSEQAGQVDEWVRIVPLGPRGEGQVAIGLIDWLSRPQLSLSTAWVLGKYLLPYDIDFLLTIETQAIPVAHEMALILSQLNSREIGCVVCRQEIKPYMKDPITATYQPAMSPDLKVAVLDGHQAQRLRGKRVALVDVAMISGATMRVLEAIAVRAGAEVVCRAAALVRGACEEDILCIRRLPPLIWSEEEGGWVEEMEVAP
jgi:adenine/guanine phosphoribosyltransferase-like PRPP-binding protein